MTISRILTNTICGIRPVDVPAYIGVQLLSGLAALLFFSWLYKNETEKKGVAPADELPAAFKVPNAFVMPQDYNGSSRPETERELAGVK